MDAVVSSLENVVSLQGGTLVLTQLQGIDGRVYGTAQGKIQIELPPEEKRAPHIHPSATVGSVQGGVSLERELPFHVLEGDKSVLIQLSQPDYVTAQRVCDVVKKTFENACRAEDPVRIKVEVPPDFKDDPVGFIARLEILTVESPMSRPRSSSMKIREP